MSPEQAARAAMGRPFLLNLVLIFFYVLRILFFALLDGVLIFFSSAAISGFFSWLVGASSPRQVALITGIAVGAVWSGSMFLIRLATWARGVHEVLQRQRIQAALDRLD